MMRLGLLKADYVNDDLIPLHGDLPHMFGRFFNEALETRVDVFEVRFGHLPDPDYSCDSFVITGSRYSVNDEVAWVSDLLAFIRARWRRDTMIGFCFGHQALAAALGGRVASRPSGPNVGARVMSMRERPSWATPFDSTPRLLFNHSEHIVATPCEGRILAGDELCPVQIVQYGERALGLQGHPEYRPAYQEALMRLNGGLSAEALDDALSRNRARSRDEALIRTWLIRFIEESAALETKSTSWGSANDLHLHHL